MLERRKQLGGFVPTRKVTVEPLKSDTLPELFAEFHKGSEGRKASTTMAFVRMLAKMLRDKEIGELVVPIVPDEARTFGMEALFRQVGIYSHVGQLYEPVDMDTLLYYKEAKDGQILEEGITEAGSISSFIAAGTRLRDARHQHDPVLHLLLDVRHAARRRPRVGGRRHAHARLPARRHGRADHARRRRAAAPGRPQAPVLAGGAEPDLVRPGVRVRDRGDHRGRHPADVHGRREHLLLHHRDERAVRHPPMPDGKDVREGILKGMYRLRASEKKKAKARAQLLGSGAILNEVLKAQEILESQYDVAADVWSVTSYQELYRDGHAAERWNRLHPGEKPRVPYVTQCLDDAEGVLVAASDYVKALPDSIDRWMPRRADRRSAPTASAAARAARRCATSSRSTPSTSSPPRWTSWRATARSTVGGRAEGDQGSGHQS